MSNKTDNFNDNEFTFHFGSYSDDEIYFLKEQLSRVHDKLIGNCLGTDIVCKDCSYCKMCQDLVLFTHLLAVEDNSRYFAKHPIKIIENENTP